MSGPASAETLVAALAAAAAVKDNGHWLHQQQHDVADYEGSVESSGVVCWLVERSETLIEVRRTTASNRG